MNVLFILRVVVVVLQLIVSGLSESEAVAQASTSFGIPERVIRKFL